MLDDYYSVLDVCLPEYLEIGVQILMASSKYFPKPAEILQAHETAMFQAIESESGIGNANRLMALIQNHPLTKIEINGWRKILQRSGLSDKYIEREIETLGAK